MLIFPGLRAGRCPCYRPAHFLHHPSFLKPVVSELYNEVFTPKPSHLLSAIYAEEEEEILPAAGPTPEAL
jgi:hypothetical protein